MSTTPQLDWTELDDKAVDTVRVLAMDAVQKVGNGHPGTAMSLAPAAYLLFQKVMRHNPADPHWPGRDRFVLSCGHSSLTLYIQLFLGGWGLELEDIEALRTWGSKTPGHPEYGHTAGVETTTGPLGQGIGNAVGMAMAARRERGLFDPGTGASPFDHQIYALCSDGDIEEGVSAEASAIAGVQELGNLTLIYDDNQISIEDDTNIALAEDVAARYAAYGWHVQDVDWTHGGNEYREDVPALLRRDQGRRGGHRQAELHPAAHDHRLAGAQRPEHRQGARLRARRRRGRGHQGGAGLRPGADLRRPPRACSSTPGSCVARGKAAQAAWDERVRRTGPPKPATARRSYDRMQTRTLPQGWADDAADVRRGREGHGHPEGVRAAVINAIAPSCPSSGAARPTWPSPTTPPSRACRRSCRPTARPRCGAATPSWGGCCTSASASTAWARS